ncbi:MAG: LysE family translocator [Pseudomonadota bacterium]
MIETFIAAWLGMIVAQATPGPNLMAVASVSLRQGRLAGFFVVLGVASGILIWVLACATGVIGLLTTYPVLGTGLKLLGGAYLVYLAARAVRAALTNTPTSIKASATHYSLSGAWRLGALVVLTNPKAALMWLAVSAFVFAGGATPTQFLLFFPIGSLTAIAIYGAYAVLFSTRTANQIFARFSRWIELAFGTVFGTLGARLVADGIRDVRT